MRTLCLTACLLVACVRGAAPESGQIVLCVAEGEHIAWELAHSHAPCESGQAEPPHPASDTAGSLDGPGGHCFDVPLVATAALPGKQKTPRVALPATGALDAPPVAPEADATARRAAGFPPEASGAPPGARCVRTVVLRL